MLSTSTQSLHLTADEARRLARAALAGQLLHERALSRLNPRDPAERSAWLASYRAAETYRQIHARLLGRREPSLTALLLKQEVRRG